ncbi:MAG: AAA family ATPase [Pseudomonadota bacterium]
MRLIEATVRNYRVHKELHIAFDASRNVIAGPNESGKSTLMEAIQNVLFEKAKGFRKAQQAMKSEIHLGTPQITLLFEAGGKQYQLTKEFKRPNGNATLTEVGGSTLGDEKAEEKLEQLLKLDSTNSNTTWDHIFVNQGASGTDPTGFANTHRSDLVARFQETGGAVLQQSEKDARVAAAIAKQVDEIFTSANKPKVNSELGKATAALDAARERLQAVEAKLASREQAIAAHAAATDAITEAEVNLKDLAAEQTAVIERRKKVDELKGQLKEQQHSALQATQLLEQYLKAQADIESARKKAAETEQTLLPLDDQIKAADETLSTARTERQLTGDRSREANSNAQAARTRVQLATLARDLRQAELKHTTLQARQSLVNTLKAEITDTRQAIAKLPLVSDSQLKTLNSLALEIVQATATVNAIAAKITVLAADQAITLDGQSLTGGDEQTFTDTAQLHIGAGVRLQIQPGGGDDLNTSREQLAAAERKQSALLAEIGVKDLAEATNALHKRESLGETLTRQSERLVQEGGDTLDEDIARAEEDLVTIRTRLDNLNAAHPDFQPAESLDAAQAVLAQAEQAEADAVAKEQSTHQAREQADAALQRAELALSAANEQAATARQAHNEATNRVQFLLDQHGDDQARAAKLATQQALVDQQAALSAETEKALEELQPELLEQDEARIKRSINMQTEQRQNANNTLQQAIGELRNDGTSDAEADVATARAAADAAEQRFQHADQYASAIRRLHTLFTEKQQALADQFTRPLAEKATDYLKTILGPDTRLNLRFDGTQFDALELYRENLAATAFNFGVLSGGTREQVAAALRLAIAEILAANFDGCLPLVFDDAFTNADPKRTHDLQRMLDLAASRGLQIIVLTCNPNDYNRFGAKQIALNT